MATTPKYALRYPDATDPADVPTDMGELATDVDNALPTKGTAAGQVPTWDGTKWVAGTGSYRGRLTSAQFTALTNLVDGDTVDLIVDPGAANYSGSIWRLRYNASGATYKWEYVGGPAIRVDQTADVVQNNAAWIDATGIGTLTLPRAGDYRLTHAGRVYFSGTSAWGGGQTIRLGAAPAAAAEQYNVNGPNPSSAGTGGYGRRDLIRTGLAAGLVLTVAHTTGGGQAVGFTERWVEAVPIRVS